MPPLIVSHSKHINKKMESHAKMVSSKHISSVKLEKIITDAYEYEQKLPDKQVSAFMIEHVEKTAEKETKSKQKIRRKDQQRSAKEIKEIEMMRKAEEEA
jgi:hypothetical protein